jgi:hypothetical protein
VTSKIRRKNKKGAAAGGGKKGAGGVVPGGSDDGAGPRTWDFPTAVGDGSEQGSEGGYTPRTPRAGGGVASKEEVAAVQVRYGTINGRGYVPGLPG